jgi:glucose dehydrogenase
MNTAGVTHHLTHLTPNKSYVFLLDAVGFTPHSFVSALQLPAKGPHHGKKSVADMKTTDFIKRQVTIHKALKC